MPSNLRWTVEEYQAHMRAHGLPTTIAPRDVGVLIRPSSPQIVWPDRFTELCRASGLPVPASEVLVIPGRDFRFDYAWPLVKIAVEQQGFRDHSTRKGLRRDYEKLNLAQAAGWKVFQFTPKQLASIDTIEWLRVQLSRVE